jgi:serine O-acetyltransferase
MINLDNFGNEIKRWFSKSIFDFENEVNFNEIDIYKLAIDAFNGDFKRYYPESQFTDFCLLKNNLPLQAILLHRIARIHYTHNKESQALLYSNLGRFLTGIEIYYTSQIGSGLKINHGYGTVIGAHTVIGNNALIHHNVTLGDKNGKRPKVLNNVTIYPGATIIGDVIIGHNSIIGANSLVLSNVPDNSVAIGNPARIITTINL